MKKRIIALSVMVVFILSVFQYGAFAASTVDGTATTEKIYDTADAKVEGTGYRLSLNDYWQVANFPDTAANIDANPFVPLSEADLTTFKAQTTINWKAIHAPSNLNLAADFLNASRVFYHAKIKVSQADIDKGRSFSFDFEGTNWIASIFVNGQLAGTKKSTRIPWKLDVTKRIIAGDNDIYIGMKSPRYAIDSLGTSMMTGEFAVRKKLSNYFTPDFKWYVSATDANLVKLKWFAPIYPSTKGGKANDEFGLTDELSFVATGGSVYVQDVFVMTNVVNTPVPSAPNPATDWKITPTSKKFSAEITLFNSSNADKTVTMNMEAALQGGTTAKTFDPQIVTILANSTKLILITDVQWADAKLWNGTLSKAESAMYDFNVSVVKDTATINNFKQAFGFRDIKIDGKFFRVNGIRRNFRHFGGTVNGSTSGAEMIANMKDLNANYERFDLVDLGTSLKNDAGKGNLNMREQLDVFDTYGIPVTFCSTIDGMAANFSVIKSGAVNTIMFENFRDTLQQTTLAYRNHPAILMWSLENEFLYINCANIFSSYMTNIEKYATSHMYAPVYALDPTRPAFTDGGCAGIKNQEAIYAQHYGESTDITTPSAPLSQLGLTKGLWEYDGKRPYVAAEVMFFSGAFSEQNWVGGETAANNQKAAYAAYSKFCSYMIDRYRWNDAAIISSVTNAQGMKGTKPAMEALDVITKDYKTTLYASKGYTNEVKIINDTLNTNPITFKWTLKVNGVDIQTKSQDFTIEPGFSANTPISIAPIANITTRTNGTLTFELSQQGSSSSVKTVTLGIFPAAPIIKITKKLYTYNISKDTARALKSLGVSYTPVPKTMKIVASKKLVKYYVIVKKKKVAKYKTVITYKTVTLMSGSNLKYFITTPTSILLVGNGGLKSAPGEGDSQATVLFARAGGRVICLEQSYDNMPYSGLEDSNFWPAEIYKFYDGGNNEWTPSLNFGQGYDQPILKGLVQSDLSFWNGGGNTASTAWQNISGAKNWVYAGPASKATTLFELPVAKGMLTATQLKVGARIAIEPVAKKLLSNLIVNANSYTPPTSTVGVLSTANTNLISILNDTKVKYAKVPSISSAMNVKTTKIFVVEANKDNLNELIRLKTQYTAYTNAGGWVMLWNLTPDALASYNTLMGTQHVIRPFRKEGTTSISDGTSIGLTTADYKLYSSTIIAPWINQTSVSTDTFTYAIDATDNIAPFHDFEKDGFGNAYLGANFDGDKASMVNNLYNGDFWHYIWQVWVAGGGYPAWDQRNTPGATPAPTTLFTFKLPKSEQIDKVTFFNNKNYNAFKGCTINALADDGTTVLSTQAATLPNSYDATDFNFNNILSKNISIIISSFYDNNGAAPMCGVDELQIFRKTPQWITDSKCFSLDSNGTIVKYQKGTGGVLLNNVKLSGFKAEEPKSNIELKAKIFAVYFQNFGARFK